MFYRLSYEANQILKNRPCEPRENTLKQGCRKISNVGADIHISVFTDHKKNLILKKLLMLNRNIRISAPIIIDLSASLLLKANCFAKVKKC